MRLTLALAASLLLVTACDQPKPREVAPLPPQATPPADAAEPAAAPAPVAAAPSAGLARLDTAPSFYIDQIGQAADPVNRRPAVTAASQPLIVSGFAFDGVAKVPAGGVDVVLDGVAHPATYGAARKDVAEYFKTPGLTNVGYTLTLPPGTLPPGEHRVAVRVIAADGKGYAESPEVPFTIR